MRVCSAPRYNSPSALDHLLNFFTLPYTLRGLPGARIRFFQLYMYSLFLLWQILLRATLFIESDL